MYNNRSITSTCTGQAIPQSDGQASSHFGSHQNKTPVADSGTLRVKHKVFLGAVDHSIWNLLKGMALLHCNQIDTW